MPGEKLDISSDAPKIYYINLNVKVAYSQGNLVPGRRVVPPRDGSTEEISADVVRGRVCMIIDQKASL